MAIPPERNRKRLKSLLRVIVVPAALDDVYHLGQDNGWDQENRDRLVWRWEHFPGFDWALEWEAVR